MKSTLQERIEYQGDITLLLEKVCRERVMGEYVSHSIISIGYEDLNLVVETTQGKFFFKIFASFRDKKDCERYVEIIKSARNAGIQQPEIYGELYETNMDGKEIRLCVMQFIEGKNLYESHYKLTGKDALFLVQEAAKINQIPLKPAIVYDSWAIVNFLPEWDKKHRYLSEDDQKLILPLVKEFEKVNVDLLPHCLVHGDLIKTNILRDNQSDKLYILDFSVANYYPRIQELAVLMCDVFFDKGNLDHYKDLYKQTLTEYQKSIPLEKVELDTLPLFAKVAHAMHLLCATYEKVINKNDTAENEYFINLGRTGLRFTSGFFNKN